MCAGARGAARGVPELHGQKKAARSRAGRLSCRSMGERVSKPCWDRLGGPGLSFAFLRTGGMTSMRRWGPRLRRCRLETGRSPTYGSESKYMVGKELGQVRLRVGSGEFWVTATPFPTPSLITHHPP